MKNYVRHWFLTKAEFESRLPSPLLTELIDAGAMPGPIYGQLAEDKWWSALTIPMADRANHIARSAALYYAPSALWWARRTLLSMNRHGHSMDQAASENRAHFIADFAARLSTQPFAATIYTACFPADIFDEKVAAAKAEIEWESWMDGGYAVCLRRFSANSCIRKEVLAAYLKRDFAAPDGEKLSTTEQFDLMEELESLLLPFAPFERPTGTPGVVVDRILRELSLGNERPYELGRLEG